MYSPKIAEDLIPALYRISRDSGKPMTKILDEILREKLTYYYTTIDNVESGSSSSKAA